jgi:FixJ family two-component response regulator
MSESLCRQSAQLLVDQGQELLGGLTIKVHRGRVMEKMQADSLADLVRMAEKLGIGGAVG